LALVNGGVGEILADAENNKFFTVLINFNLEIWIM